MCSIQFECCPSTTVTLGPIKNSLIILSLYLSTVFQSFRAGEKGYYVTPFCLFGYTINSSINYKNTKSIQQKDKFMFVQINMNVSRTLLAMDHLKPIFI